MPDDLIDILRKATSSSMASKVVFAIEDHYPPQLLQQMLPLLGRMPGPAREAIHRSPVLHLLSSAPAEHYERARIASGVVLYRGGSSPAGRALLVVLCGRYPRPMMAVSLFLQHVPAALFDVLVLHDDRNDHYVNGIAGYAESRHALGHRVVSEFDASAYRRLYFYGTSSGGLAAVQLAVLFGAFRGVSLGGLFPWPINRLESAEDYDAFDPICACNRGRPRDLVFVHADLQPDRDHARRAVALVGGRGFAVSDATEHNVLHHLFTTGRLPPFHQQVLGFRPDPQGRPEFTQAP